MGACTVSIVKRQPLGGTARNCLADVTWSASYATGGDTFTPSQFGMSAVNHIDAGTAVASATTGYGVMPDIANSKLKLVGGAASGVAGAEVTAATDTHLVVARVLVVGDSPYV